MAKGIYYGPDKYKGIVANLPKSQQKKYKGKYIGPDKFKGFINGVVPKSLKPIVRLKPEDKTINPNLITTLTQESTTQVNEEMAGQIYALALNELYLYANLNTVDGIFDDVAIISILSDQRRDFQIPFIFPPDPTFIEDMYIEGNILNIVVSSNPIGHDIILEFYGLATDNLITIPSDDYV